MITSSSSVWRNCLSPGLRLRALLPVLFCVLAAAAQPALPTNTGANPLKRVHHWMYQLQGMEDAAAMDKLAQSPYDLLVIEPTFTLKGEADFDAKALVAKLKAAHPGRLVVAYADIGEAERFRIEMEHRVATLAGEIATLKERLRSEGERERQALERQGEGEAARLVSQIEQEAARRVQDARRQLASEAASVAADLAVELLRRELTAEDRERIFRTTLERLGERPAGSAP